MIKQHKDMKGIDKPRREQPLAEQAKASKNNIVLVPEGLPDDAEFIGEDITVRYTLSRVTSRRSLSRERNTKTQEGFITM